MIRMDQSIAMRCQNIATRNALVGVGKVSIWSYFGQHILMCCATLGVELINFNLHRDLNTEEAHSIDI